MNNLNNSQKMARRLVNELKKKLGDKFGSYNIYDTFDTTNYKTFKISFKAYDYFIILITYNKGVIQCWIKCVDNQLIQLRNSQMWYKTADFTIFCRELQDQLELRIPDKFLAERGWK